MQQGSEEWFAARLGKVTASRVADVIAKTKSGSWGASRANYAAQLISERLTGHSADSYTNAAMAHGTATEPQARAAYEFFKNCDVTEVGFIAHPSIEMAGASPDGLVGDAGLIEIKCPTTAVHIENVLGRTVPAKYKAQVQFQMACTGRQWCDFVSFDPRMPESMRLFVSRITRDDALIADLEREVSTFVAEMNSKVVELRLMFDAGQRAAA